MTETVLDLNFVRSHFPQLENGWVFFENAGGSYVPISVTERVNRYMRELQVQPGGPWPPSQRAAEMIAEGQHAMAGMINASLEEVIIGPSTTLNVYVLSNALAPWFKAGDELIVTNQDHEANIGAWRSLADKGVVVKEWCVNPRTAELEIDDLKKLLNKKTKLVCFPHVSNIVGTINDVEQITALAHEVGAMVCVDGVAYAAHRSVDVKALDVDFYLLSIYKVYGPHLALLYGKKELLLKAANQNHYFFSDDVLPGKLNPGGQQHELAASLLGIIEYFETLYSHHVKSDQTTALKDRIDHVFRLIAEHEQALSDALLSYLTAQDNVRVIGRHVPDRQQRVPTISFCIDGLAPVKLASKLSAKNIAMRDGHFYAHRLIKALGLLNSGGVVRCSMLHYNTLDEVAALVDALQHLGRV